jgi:WD40 repeat protein
VVVFSPNTYHPVGSASLGQPGALCLDVSADGTHFAVGDTQGRVTVWDSRSRKRIGAVLRGGTARVTAVAFSPDGKTIASGTSYGQVFLWRLEDGAKIWQHAGGSHIRALRWRPDGASVLAVGITLDRLASDTGRPAGSAIATGVGEASSLTVSSDGSEAAIGGFSGKIAIVNLETGQVRYVLTGHSGHVSGVAFVNNDQTVISAGDDGAVLARDLDPDAWARRACTEAGRNLTPEEVRSYGTKDAHVCRDDHA